MKPLTEGRRRALRAGRKRVRRMRSRQARWAVGLGVAMTVASGLGGLACFHAVTWLDLRPGALSDEALAKRLEELRPGLEAELGQPLPDLRIRSLTGEAFASEVLSEKGRAQELLALGHSEHRLRPVTEDDRLGWVRRDGPDRGEILINRQAMLRWAERYPHDDRDFLDTVLVRQAAQVFQQRNGLWTQPLLPSDPHDVHLAHWATVEGHAEVVARRVLARQGRSTAGRQARYWRDSPWPEHHERNCCRHHRTALDRHQLIHVRGPELVEAVLAYAGDEEGLAMLGAYPPENRYELRDPEVYLERVLPKLARR